MLSKKICLVGDFGVGKTSLVSRYVHQTFSDKYLSTIGVKVDTKSISTESFSVNLVLWDLAGKGAFDTLDFAYLRGAAGVLLVADGTRNETLVAALHLKNQMELEFGSLPTVVVVNKCDLMDQWEMPVSDGSPFGSVIETSAKTGVGVELAFETLARKVMKP